MQSSNQKIESASKDLASSIVECMTRLRGLLGSGVRVYSVALVVSDDFSDIQIFANTDQHFAASNHTDLDRWYFGQYWSQGMDVEFESLTKCLGKVEHWDEDDNLEESNAVDWLAAMTHAMRLARTQRAFVFDGQEATVFCSMVDSLNAIWLEELSARFLNAPDAYASAAPGLKAASSEWYRPEGDDEYSAFRAAYKDRLTRRSF